VQESKSSLSIQERPLYLGSCSYENSSDATQKLFHGDLGNFQIWDRFVPETQIKGIVSASGNPGDAQLIYSLISDDNINKDLRTVDIPAFTVGNISHSALFTDRMSAFVTCKVASPMNITLDNVRKPSSMTVMAWMRMSSLPYRQEACILSHGSWEDGWKLSILPYLNLQLSIRSSAGDVLEFFSKPFTPSLHWQHIAVSYNEEDASVIFYVNGFPLELESIPDLIKDRDYSIASQAAPMTIGRCYPVIDNPSDETLKGHVSDVMVWDGVLDFQAIRSIARGETASAESIRELRHALPGRQLVFALPALGCIGE
jgi:hypothetical protein